MCLLAVLCLTGAKGHGWGSARSSSQGVSLSNCSRTVLCTYNTQCPGILDPSKDPNWAGRFAMKEMICSERTCAPILQSTVSVGAYLWLLTSLLCQRLISPCCVCWCRSQPRVISPKIMNASELVCIDLRCRQGTAKVPQSPRISLSRGSGEADQGRICRALIDVGVIHLFVTAQYCEQRWPSDA